MLRTVCEEAAKNVILQDIQAAKNDLRHFTFIEEQDIVSRTYLEIVRNRTGRNLLKYPAECRDRAPTLYAEFPTKYLDREGTRGGQTNYLDLAIVKQSTKDTLARPSAHIHYYELVGVIEVKYSVDFDIRGDLKRIRKLLVEYKNAFGILVVGYWWKSKAMRAKNNLKAIRNHRKLSEWNRMNILTEYSEFKFPWKHKATKHEFSLMDKYDLLKLEPIQQ